MKQIALVLAILLLMCQVVGAVTSQDLQDNLNYRLVKAYYQKIEAEEMLKLLVGEQTGHTKAGSVWREKVKELEAEIKALKEERAKELEAEVIKDKEVKSEDKPEDTNTNTDTTDIGITDNAESPETAPIGE